MNQAQIPELHRRLFAALDNDQESYAMVKTGTFLDNEMCQDLLEQLAISQKTAKQWRALLADGEPRH